MTTARSSGGEDGPPRRSAPSSRPPRSARTAASSSTSSTDVEAGRVGRPHGLDGAFYVTRPLPGLLRAGARVTIGGRVREIERRAGTDAKPFVRVTGCGSREEAEGLRGEPLLVAHADLPELGPGEYWAHELEGCEVADGERRVGTVRRMVTLPSCEALEVDGLDALVPLVGDAVRSVDVGARRIDVDLAFLGEA